MILHFKDVGRARQSWMSVCNGDPSFEWLVEQVKMHVSIEGYIVDVELYNNYTGKVFFGTSVVGILSWEDDVATM